MSRISTLYKLPLLVLACVALSLPGTARADSLSQVPQLSGGAGSAYVSQLPRQARPYVRSAPRRVIRRVQQVPRRTVQQTRTAAVQNSRIVDFGESTEALGFRVPSVRQGVRIVAR